MNALYIFENFKIGQRVELLDNLESTRLRPARIMKIRGRRVCVQVTPEECSERDPDDRQVGTNVNNYISPSMDPKVASGLMKTAFLFSPLDGLN